MFGVGVKGNRLISLITGRGLGGPRGLNDGLRLLFDALCIFLAVSVLITLVLALCFGRRIFDGMALKPPAARMSILEMDSLAEDNFLEVTGSGQFVGVAEMIGQVQLDKWNGFCPVKGHIILENNEDWPVTYTQEIGLKQGLEMLSILKNYSEQTSSVLDDLVFYEKSLRAKRNSKPASQTNGDYENHSEVDGEQQSSAAKTNESDASSLISLTKNLALNSQST